MSDELKPGIGDALLAFIHSQKPEVAAGIGYSGDHWSIMVNYGREADDSPMFGASAIGADESLVATIEQTLGKHREFAAALDEQHMFTPAQVQQLCHDLVAARGLIRKLVETTITRQEYNAILPWLESMDERIPTAVVYTSAVRAEHASPWTEGMTL